MRNLTLVATPLCVKGIPNSAAIPEAAVIPAKETKVTLKSSFLKLVMHRHDVGNQNVIC